MNFMTAIIKLNFKFKSKIKTRVKWENSLLGEVKINFADKKALSGRDGEPM